MREMQLCLAVVRKVIIQDIYVTITSATASFLFIITYLSILFLLFLVLSSWLMKA